MYDVFEMEDTILFQLFAIVIALHSLEEIPLDTNFTQNGKVY